MQAPNGNIVFGSFDGGIYCLDNQGRLVGRHQTGKKVVSSPAMVNDSVFAIGGIDRNIYLLTTKGRLLGSIKCSGSFFSTPIAMPDGTLFCCTMNGYLYFIDKEIISNIISGRTNTIDLETEKIDYTY